MKIYSQHGINDFIICCGYKGYVIKEYFNNYFLHQSDVTFDFTNNQINYHEKRAENWKVTLVDTGDLTMTGGRLLRVKDYLKNENEFCFTYGDGVGDIDITALLKFHKNHGKYATMTATYPPGRFGAIDINENNVINSFQEKPKGDGTLINGGFFVLNPAVFEHIQEDSTIWEKEPLENLAKIGQLMAYKHDGFWQPMDTLRDKNNLKKLWSENKAPWKNW
jgi:glucose-1-phosphate cytidylyltransferase